MWRPKHRSSPIDPTKKGMTSKRLGEQFHNYSDESLYLSFKTNTSKGNH